MTRRLSVRLILGGLVALLLAGALAWSRSDRGFPPRAEAKRPPLMLVTTLPMLFPEELSLKAIDSPAVVVIDHRYRVIPIGITESAQLRQARMLFMAHPLAQPAEALVDLDQWVRGGGRLLLLADPKLDWPSKGAFGDVLRPPQSFADTGLLAHWGLRLEAPAEDGLVKRKLGGFTILTSSPGQLDGKACDIGTDGFVAHCRIGKGKATIVADADFLRLFDGDGLGAENNDGLLAELSALER
jgi:hypothetical protein